MTDAHDVEWPWLGRVPGATPRHLGGRAVVGGRGMVVAPQPLAADAGVAVLRAGGNAVDAAVATSAVLMVTVPMQTGPGGDAIWLVRPPGGTAVALNGTGRSGARLDPEQARAAAARDHERGAWTVTVPGAVASWAAALERFGTMSLAELLAPAIGLAEDGFFVSRYLHAALTAAEGILRRSPQGREWFLARGVPAVYSRLRQPALARCLRLLASTNGEALYRGEIAAAIASALAGAGGFLDEDDLAAHESRFAAPLTAQLGDLELLQAPPNSQGVVLLEALRLAEARTGAPLPDLERADGLHVAVESLRAALSDRDAVVADPERSAGAEVLLDDGYLAARAAEIDPDRASAGWPPGVGAAARIASARDGDTANLVAVDGSGLAVSLTQSLYCDFGSGVPVPGFGFMLQNRGACFSLAPEACNAIGPARRPLHTLMPGMAVSGAAIRYVFGCMGGHGQAQTQAQLLSRLAAGDDPQDAVAAPRFFADPEAVEPVLYVERRLSARLRDELAARGHPLRVLGDWEEIMGHAQLVAVEPSGALVGAGDPRTDGAAAAW
jgi:gamma-glutamyltranspeptidase/glutathione hydrolase